MDDLGKHIGDLLAAGKKIEAIKVLREVTGLGLADAKNVVDAVESGTPVPPEVLQRVHARIEAAAAEELPADVLAIAAAGDRIRAIKLLREQRGLGLKEAKDLLDQAMPVSALTARRGCLLPLLFGCAIGFVALGRAVQLV